MPGDLWEKGKVIWLWGASDISNPLGPILQDSVVAGNVRIATKEGVSKWHLDQTEPKESPLEKGLNTQSYLHVLDSKMRGRDEQSSLLLARFWPSLQQSSIDICFASMGGKRRSVVVFLQIAFLHTQAAAKRFNKKNKKQKNTCTCIDIIANSDVVSLLLTTHLPAITQAG